MKLRRGSGVREIGKFKTGIRERKVFHIHYQLSRILAKLDSVVVQLNEMNHRLDLQDREVEGVKEMLMDIKAKI